MVLRCMQVMLEVMQDEVRPVDAPLDGTGHPALHLEASPAAEKAAPEPALTGASGSGQDDARRP